MRSAVAAMAVVAVVACSDSLGPGEEPDLTGTWMLTAETIPASTTFCTLEFTLGEGMVIPGFENAIVGMTDGEMKTVSIPPDEGYGPYSDELIA